MTNKSTLGFLGTKSSSADKAAPPILKVPTNILIGILGECPLIACSER